MRTHITLALLCIIQLSHGQVIDDFNDSDLNVQPQWSGQLNNFVTDHKELRSNCGILNSTFYMATPSGFYTNCDWLLDTRLMLNTSSLNYTDFVVISDSMNLLKMRNGYFVRMGGSTDEISLYKTKNGVETKIIDGTDNVLNSSNNQWKIKLKRTGAGVFILERQLLAGGALIAEGMVSDTDILSSACLGLRIRQSTASFFGKHYFDNLYCGKIIRDTLAPVLDSLVLAVPRQLYCVFNEDCDSASLADGMNYNISPGNIYPDAVILQNRRKVMLHFKDKFFPNTYLNLNVRAVKDTSGNVILPVTKPFYYSLPDTAGFHRLLITELMPDPNPVVGLPDKEYVEITNNSGGYIQLKGCMIHDPSGGKNLPDKILAPDSIVVLYSIPSLNNAGDRIWLTNQNGQVIHTVSYTDDWYRDTKKKNGGWSLEMIDLHNLCAGAANWVASMDKRGGTPGQTNSVKGYGVKDTMAPLLVQAIPVNDSIIRLTFNEEIDSINSGNFNISKYGQVRGFRLKNMTGDLQGNEWLIDFVPDTDSLYEFIFSGIKDCAGNERIGQRFKIQWPSISHRNELIFNEVLFNPKSGGYDFIEIYNNSSKAFDLSKHFIAVLDETNQYKSIEKLSSAQLIIRPYQYLLISENTSKICSSYNCKNQDALNLDFNKMPSMPDDEGNLLLVNLNGKIIDSLYYSADRHFPLLSDKEGVSLERISFTTATRSIDNWHSAASAVGFATPGYLNSQSSSVNGSGKYFSLQNKTVSPDEDGYEDVLILNYSLPKQDYLTTINIYDTEGRLVQQWINNETLGTTGFVTWNGTDYNRQKAAIGMYILQIECTHPDGSKIREKLSCVVAGKF